MAKPREPKRRDATRRDDGPNRYDVMPELPCFAAFRFDFVFLCFCFPGIFAVVVFYVFVSFSISFNTFAVVAGIQHVSDFGQSKDENESKSRNEYDIISYINRAFYSALIGPTK